MGTDLTKVTERVRLGRGPGPQGTPPKDSRTLQTDREGGGEGMARGVARGVARGWRGDGEGLLFGGLGLESPACHILPCGVASPLASEPQGTHLSGGVFPFTL